MKFKGEKFLPEEKLDKKAAEWQNGTRKEERIKYVINRSEKSGGEAVFEEENDSIENLHNASFIDDIIPKLISKKKAGEKVRILDIGTGAAYFTDEIRKKFPNQVKVFSTGLSKQAARDYRNEHDNVKERNLHPDDLKWRSVLQLSDFEEFDLIIDTFGEYFYAPISAKTNTAEERKAIFTEYLTAIIKKLKPGGLASISPSNITASSINKTGYPDLDFLADLSRQNNVKIYEFGAEALRIEKPEKEQ